jgi:hypothetical protein
MEEARSRPDKPDEQPRSAAAARAPEPLAGTLAFMPWLRLAAPVSAGNIVFVPFLDGDRRVAPELAEIEPIIAMILSSYVDREGAPIRNGVIVTTADRGWQVVDDDHDSVTWATQLLFLASWSFSQFFSQLGYVNATPFRVLWQRFDDGSNIAISARRRDGQTLSGGYEHGKAKFSVPPQCGVDRVDVDTAFLDALVRADASGSSETIERLSLPFVSLANTDDDLMDERAEIILMASAFEHLFDADASKYALVTGFGDVFAPYRAVLVDEALAIRPTIALDPDPVRAAAQRHWPVHKKWIEELYDRRSKAAHKPGPATRAWAWSPFQHLVMAAFTFPLAVKLLLARERHYGLTSDDTGKCKAIDLLLIADHWNRADGESCPKWAELVEKSKDDVRLVVAMEGMQAAMVEAERASTNGREPEP